MAKKFIIAGGGTGGHIFPAVAIANAIKMIMPSAEFLFVGAKGKMEMEKVPKAGFAIVGLDIAGFDRSAMFKNISLPFKLVLSFLQVIKIFRKFRPDAVIGVGGYSSFPVLRFAQAHGIKTFIHESNSFAGKANILLGKKAAKIFVATKGMDQFFPSDKIVITGNPVRKSIAECTMSRNTAIAFFGLNPTKKTVLAVGGSLGAKSINEALLNGMEAFEQNNIQLIWQTGKQGSTVYKESARLKSHIWISDFIQEMEYGYAAADLVVSRAGAMAVTELAVVGKPAVLVPYPHAAEDHQTANALQLVNEEAAMIVTDGETKEHLVKTVIDLVKNEDELNTLTTNIKKLAILNADVLIANEILKMI
ncbi:MAG: undecaprenyldiphospho-muramoylpentapeptide beta-N-acetylglucosaminyltransferase [Sphingobacteriia bacterium]|nr:MAG: undecaprenyldiphospho-muramoylpentapeptide beta-N-acetylglucosaminyltransferase [Sphingobacteriia bacterium]